MKNYKRMIWCILGIPYLIGRCSIKSTGANPICSTEKITSSHYNCHLQQVFNEYPKHCPRTWPSFVCKTLCWALVVNLNTYSKWNPHWPIGKKNTHTVKVDKNYLYSQSSYSGYFPSNWHCNLWTPSISVSSCKSERKPLLQLSISNME